VAINYPSLKGFIKISGRNNFEYEESSILAPKKTNFETVQDQNLQLIKMKNSEIINKTLNEL